ncbi:MAG: PKD domain-containing protein [bacterium]
MQTEKGSFLPALPSPAELLAAGGDAAAPQRSISFVSFAEGERLGSEFLPGLVNANLAPETDGEGVQFSPAWTGGSGSTAYGIYELQFPAYAADPMKLRLQWRKASTEGNVYIGLANWESNRWDWQAGPWFKAQSLPLGDISAWLTPATGRLYIVVLALGEDPLLLEQLNMFTQLPPKAVLQLSTLSGEAPLQINVGGINSSDPDGSIADYHWDFDGDGIFNEPGAEATAQGSGGPHTLDFATAGTYDISLRVLDDYGDSDTSTRQLFVSDSPPPLADLQADVTSGSVPLSVSFDASGSSDPDGTITGYSWDFDGDGIFNESGPEGLAQGSSMPAAVTYSNPGSYEAGVRVTDNDGNISQASLLITASSSPPVAVLSASASVGAYPLKLSFDATGSSDPDNDIANYEWDLDGDGNYSELSSIPAESTDAWGNPVSGQPLLNAVVYMDELDITVSVRVTDAEGNVATDSVPLRVTPWDAYAVTPPGSGDGCAVLDVNDRPAISFYDDANDKMMYARADTAYGSSGSSWGAVIIDDLGVPYTDLSGRTRLRIVDGNPALAYCNGDGKELYYVRATDQSGASGAAWPSPTLVDNSTSFCRFPDLEVINGNPAIAYRCSTELRYLRATDTTGTSWGSPIILSDGGYTSDLLEIDGLATVTDWQLGSSQGLNVHRFSDAANFTSLFGQRLAADGYLRGHRLLEIGGKPAIIGELSTLNRLTFQQSSSVDGLDAADWGSDVNIIGNNQTGAENFAAIVHEGVPIVAYNTFGNGIFYVEAVNSSGSPDGSSGMDWQFNRQIVHGPVDASDLDLAIIGGIPALVYHDNSDDRLHYMVKLPADATGE